MIPTVVEENSTKYGLLTVVAGLVLLLILRTWTSPITRRITGQGNPGLTDFLLIPVFFIVVTVGILLFLWEPE